MKKMILVALFLCMHVKEAWGSEVNSRSLSQTDIAVGSMVDYTFLGLITPGGKMEAECLL